jgi:hypothetical protein
MPIVKVGDKRIKFPDSMSQEEIGAALQKQFSGSAANDQMPEEQPVLHPDVPGIDSIPSEQPEPPPETTAQKIQRLQNTPNPADAIVEPIKALVTGATTGPLMGLLGAGIGAAQELATGKTGTGLAEQISELYRRGATYEPKTQRGKENLQAVAESPLLNNPLTEFLGRLPPVMPISGAAGVFTKATAERQTLGQPLAKVDEAAMAEKPRMRVVAGQEATVPYIAPVKVADNFLSTDTLNQAKIRKAIDEKTVEAAGYRVDNGKVISDNLQTDLLKGALKGKEKTVVKIAQAKGQQNEAILKMLDKTEKFVRGVKGSAEDLPEVVIGERVAKRFDALKYDLEKSAKKISEAVDKDLSGKPVDISEYVSDFAGALEDQGVRDVGGKLDFSKSTIVGDTSRNKIQDVYKLIDSGYADASQLHRIKQAIAKHIDFATPLTGKSDATGEKALRQLHAAINDKLRGMSKDYELANKEYSLSSDALTDLVKAFDTEGTLKKGGEDFKLELVNDRIPNALGLAARKVITNYKSSNDIIKAINKANKRTSDIGIKFSDDIMELAQINDDIQNAVGRFKSGSAAGIVEQGANVGAQKVLGPLAPIAKAGYEGIKDKLVTPRPSKEQLQTIKKMRELAERNRGVK